MDGLGYEQRRGQRRGATVRVGAEAAEERGAGHAARGKRRGRQTHVDGAVTPAVLNHPWSDQPTGKQPGLQFSPNKFLRSSRVETDGVTGSALQVALQHPVAWRTGPSTWQAAPVTMV